MYHIGIDIGGTKISIGVVDDNGVILGKTKLYVKECQNLIDDSASAVKKILEEVGIKIGEVASCGIGIPGTVSSDNRSVVKAPNLALPTLELADAFEIVLGIPVKLVQDSRAAAWGEYKVGAGKGYKTVMCISIGTGMGTGLVVDGKIYDGALGCAGEIGHTPVKKNGRKCGCGKIGCVEKYSAGMGLDITASELYGDGKTAPYLFEMAEKGNNQAISAISEAIELLGNVIVCAINLISPDCVLFSGGISERKIQYIDPLTEYIKSHCYSSDGIVPYIGVATIGPDAPLVGAALI